MSLRVRWAALCHASIGGGGRRIKRLLILIIGRGHTAGRDRAARAARGTGG